MSAIKCGICWEKIRHDNTVVTPCKHNYCTPCFFRWLKEKQNCPACRNEFGNHIVENREEFLKHAELRLGKTEEKHSSELSKRHEEIEKQFEGVQKKMETFQELHRKIEEQRVKDFGSLNQN